MLAAWVIGFNLHVLTPLACLFLGFFVASGRVWDARAWLLLAVLVSFSVVSDGSNRVDQVMSWSTPLKHVALIYRSAVINSWPICMLLFAIYFPERAVFDRRYPWLKWIFLAPALAEYAAAAFYRVMTNEGMHSSLGLELTEMMGAPRLAMMYACLTLFLVVLVAKFVKTSDPDDRRRLRVLFTGLALSFIPALIVEFSSRSMVKMHEDSLPVWILVPVFAAFALFPLTLAYVTFVQRALDVRVILRQGLQYALARRGLVFLQLAVSIAVVLLVALLSKRFSFPERAGLTAAGIGLIFLVTLGGRKLAKWIDRRFFRDAHDAEQLLARLAESVETLIELPPLLTAVGTRLAAALHISELAVFLREQKSYSVAFALGYSEPPGLAFPTGSGIVGELQRERRALPVYLDDPRSWAAGIDDEEQNALDELEAQLLVPLTWREELLGFLSLGRRYAETPYSARDMELLQSVAQQTALAVQNSRLTSTVATEVAEREVLQRELSIARDVQQQLFPQTRPHTRGLEYFGVCRPAREVGGDYYDFLTLPGEGLGLAIGDVSGKGIPAALLMASLQASLRGQTLGGCRDLQKLMSNVNQLVYMASSSNRYATFFYAQYAADARRLTYVNAGHNAPLVLREADGQLQTIRLDTGGPPVGLLPKCEYESSFIDLLAGDRIVLFTDGISETMNIQDDEWGEAKMIETIRNAWDASPEAMVERIFREADGFAGGAPQHDDMTIVVAAAG